MTQHYCPGWSAEPPDCRLVLLSVTELARICEAIWRYRSAYLHLVPVQILSANAGDIACLASCIMQTKEPVHTLVVHGEPFATCSPIRKTCECLSCFSYNALCWEWKSARAVLHEYMHHIWRISASFVTCMETMWDTYISYMQSAWTVAENCCRRNGVLYIIGTSAAHWLGGVLCCPPHICTAIKRSVSSLSFLSRESPKEFSGHMTC